LITDREQHISLNERENDALISDAGRKRSLLVASKASITNRAHERSIAAPIVDH